jgi:molybdate transport system regulatory protein
MAKLTIRLDFDSGASIGPGKIRLLEAIEATGSIRKAAEETAMSFRQAWLLLKAIEDMFDAPLVATVRGGSRGGGSVLTDLGKSTVAAYRRLERSATAATRREMGALEARTRQGPASVGKSAARLARRPLKTRSS